MQEKGRHEGFWGDVCYIRVCRMLGLSFFFVLFRWSFFVFYIPSAHIYICAETTYSALPLLIPAARGIQGSFNVNHLSFAEQL